MNIFVGNLSHEVSEDDLRGFFTAYGYAANVALVGDSYPPSSAPRSSGGGWFPGRRFYCGRSGY